ncbi:hypothetical protein, partial [Nonomuraea deserti]|uniref:hypothetical protein n=1 Tax=Nonomuraea deserti TaxID=1848322 RepID=UPI00140554BC
MTDNPLPNPRKSPDSEPPLPAWMTRHFSQIETPSGGGVFRRQPTQRRGDLVGGPFEHLSQGHLGDR